MEIPADGDACADGGLMEAPADEEQRDASADEG